VKWDDQPYSIDAVPDSFARAYRIANTEPKGPTYICFDVGIQEDPLEREVPLLNVQKLMPPTSFQASASAIEQAADLLVKAKKPVAVAGYMGRNKEAVGKLIELSELFALPVIDKTYRFNFPNTHPMDLNGSKCLESADLVLALDVRDLAASIKKRNPVNNRLESILPDDCKIIEMGLSDVGINSWSTEYEKIQEADLSIFCDTNEALPELILRCKEKLSGKEAKQEEIGQRFKILGAEHAKIRGQWQTDAHEDWDLTPMTMPRLVSEVWEVIKNEDWVLTANSVRGWTRKLWNMDEPYRYPGRQLGTATQINMSLGVALAYKGTGRLVVDIQPDGDLLFDSSALWTASAHNIPMLVIMLNNRSYLNSRQHQAIMAKERGTPLERVTMGTDINHPAPDFAGLARSFGWYAQGPIENGNDVQDALKKAIQFIQKEKKPALIDTVVQHF